MEDMYSRRGQLAHEIENAMTDNGEIPTVFLKAWIAVRERLEGTSFKSDLHSPASLRTMANAMHYAINSYLLNHVD